MKNTIIKMNYKGLTAHVSIHYVDPFDIEEYDCSGNPIIVDKFREKLEEKPSGYFIGSCSSNNIEHFIQSAYRVSKAFEGLEYTVINPPEFGGDNDPNAIY